ncbi:hypothetical protein EHF33_06605 [Deinococcus psychrotolerans]|uniref:Uncharacterized protein n=1 Tax=Deinococcus psychrotolerans TaxID=2489213 RepID=A0A3G8YAQ0_9DEIO|nr:hypothetical protein [Deinococcus psychrotolerans]AZI42459.1 hypothetical protein EHF33_06605 [Deinococcus psychrotolerans]
MKHIALTIFLVSAFMLGSGSSKINDKVPAGASFDARINNLDGLLFAKPTSADACASWKLSGMAAERKWKLVKVTAKVSDMPSDYALQRIMGGIDGLLTPKGSYGGNDEAINAIQKFTETSDLVYAGLFSFSWSPKLVYFIGTKPLEKETSIVCYAAFQR